MMEFELLRSFVAVAECGGFRRAAERLNLTQSTVSQQIKRLELETKRPLFRRTTRRVALTDDGEMLLGDARRLLQFEEAARHRLAAPRLSGTVRLGVVEEVAGGSLPSALGRFAKLHPGVKLEVQTGVSAELIEQLNAGQLDTVFAKRPLGTSKGRLVWREPLVWAAADTFDLVAGAALPLALYRERSVSSRGGARGAQRQRTDLGDHLYQPQFDGRARGGARGPRYHPASCQRADRGLAHSRSGRGAAASTRSRVRGLREGAARQGRRRAGCGSVDACTGTITPGDLKRLLAS
jgi:DNA-binding transcriptional LysR family regulator